MTGVDAMYVLCIFRRLGFLFYSSEGFEILHKNRFTYGYEA